MEEGTLRLRAKGRGGGILGFNASGLTAVVPTSFVVRSHVVSFLPPLRRKWHLMRKTCKCSEMCTIYFGLVEISCFFSVGCSD